MTTGGSIRELRETFKVSLDDAARATGLTPVMLDLIEKGAATTSAEREAIRSAILDLVRSRTPAPRSTPGPGNNPYRRGRR